MAFSVWRVHACFIFAVLAAELISAINHDFAVDESFTVEGPDHNDPGKVDIVTSTQKHLEIPKEDFVRLLNLTNLQYEEPKADLYKLVAGIAVVFSMLLTAAALFFVCRVSRSHIVSAKILTEDNVNAIHPNSKDETDEPNQCIPKNASLPTLKVLVKRLSMGSNPEKESSKRSPKSRRGRLKRRITDGSPLLASTTQRRESLMEGAPLLAESSRHSPDLEKRVSFVQSALKTVRSASKILNSGLERIGVVDDLDLDRIHYESPRRSFLGYPKAPEEDDEYNYEKEYKLGSAAEDDEDEAEVEMITDEATLIRHTSFDTGDSNTQFSIV